MIEREQSRTDARVVHLRLTSEGAGLTLDTAVGYARRTRGSRRRPASGWSSLTPTELAVVRLVVEGLTNPEIGARLFMSRETVKTHLSRIFTKLDTANRTELAAAATDRGLLAAVDRPSGGHPPV